jgi:hypothetical protein
MQLDDLKCNTFSLSFICLFGLPSASIIAMSSMTCQAAHCPVSNLPFTPRVSKSRIRVSTSRPSIPNMDSAFPFNGQRFQMWNPSIPFSPCVSKPGFSIYPSRPKSQNPDVGRTVVKNRLASSSVVLYAHTKAR